MNTDARSDTAHPLPNEPDAAAVFACALSLWRACHKHTRMESMNLSECFNGVDELMREVMRVGYEFESWACSNVAFEELDEVWPYFLEDGFGEACLRVVPLSAVTEFDETACLRVALAMRLPVNLAADFPVPIDARAMNPKCGAGFSEFRIQTLRQLIGDDCVLQLTYDDDPFDSRFGPVFFSLFGVGDDGLLEHIADRKAYREAVVLAQKIAPGVEFLRHRL